MQKERVCKAGVGPPILIQNYRNRGPTRSFGAGVQAPGGSPQGRSLKALGGHRPYSHTGQIKGPARPSGTLPISPQAHENPAMRTMPMKILVALLMPLVYASAASTPSVEGLIVSARALPAEFAADALVRLAALDQVDRARKIGWLEQAF